MVPIFKKGSRTDAANYRPVSLTSIPCKIMESLIKASMSSLLEENKTITDRQHGFMKNRSCLTNLLECFENWTQALDEGFEVDVVYLDYRKAFDSVPILRLIEKLKTYGLKGKVLQWIKSFLTSRTMKVLLKGSFSELMEVLSGVPQGSVLGPLLFILFVNDLPDWIVSSMIMFADDTKLWRTIKNAEDSKILQSDLDALMNWSTKYLLKFNPQKCKLMHIGQTCSAHTEYHLEEETGKYKIQETTEERDLGVIVMSSLHPRTQ